MVSNHPSRTVRPAQKLNGDNIGDHQVASHRNFVEAAKSDLTAISSNTPEPSTQPEASSETESVPESEPVCRNVGKRRVAQESEAASSNNDNNSDNGSESQATETQHKPLKLKKKSKKKKKTAHGMTTMYSFLL